MGGSMSARTMGPYGGDVQYIGTGNLAVLDTTPIRKVTIIPRQVQVPNGGDEAFVAVPSTYGAQASSPPPGAVVGIVLGSVAAFLALLLLFYWILNRGGPLRFGGGGGGGGDEEEARIESRSGLGFAAPRRKPPPSSSRRKGSRRKRGGRVAETTEVRSYERISTGGDGTAPHRGGPVIVEPPAVEESVRPVSDVEEEIVVVEEHRPVPVPVRRESRGYRRESGGGYRDIDPGRFAGGHAPVREVRRSSGRHGRRRS